MQTSIERAHLKWHTIGPVVIDGKLSISEHSRQFIANGFKTAEATTGVAVTALFMLMRSFFFPLTFWNRLVQEDRDA